MCDDFSIINPFQEGLRTFEKLLKAEPFLVSLESSLESLTFGNVVDISNLDKGGALALRDIYSDKYQAYLSEDKYNKGKYALAFTLRGNKNE